MQALLALAHLRNGDTYTRPPAESVLASTGILTLGAAVHAVRRQGV